MNFALIVSFVGGVALFVSQPPRRANWLQFPSLFALLWAIQSAASNFEAAFCGLAFALAYIGPQLLELRLHPAISAVLALSQSALWTVFAWGAADFGRLHSLQGALLTACLGAFLTYLEWSLLPLWGTAQNFSRGWSRAPHLVQFVALTGVSGAVWCLFWIESLAVNLSVTPGEWRSTLGALALTLAVLGALNCWFWQRENAAPTVRVAAFGWGEWDGAINRNREVVTAVRQAAQQRAALLVTPEAAFQIEDRAAFRRIFGDLARTHRIALAIGYFDTVRNQNCTDLFDSSGEVVGRYIKTRLVPLFENYTRGNGEIAQMRVGDARVGDVLVGSLICQDDNFAAGAARYGRAQTQILAIPTHDWRAVKDFHAVNARWRGLEFRIGLVKAASGGISFIASPRGEILAQCDPLSSEGRLLVAEMPISNGQMSFYARARDYFPLGCGFTVLMGWLLLPKI